MQSQDITCDPVKLRITTDVDGLAGKAIKMKVGSEVFLSEYLTYKQKNIKLSQYNNKDLVVTLEDPDGAFELTPKVYDGELQIFDYKIIAKRPTTRPLELKVSDKTVTKNGGSEITIKLSASALDQSRALKHMMCMIHREVFALIMLAAWILPTYNSALK